MIRTLLRILFPPNCFGCGKEPFPICYRCLNLTRKSLSSPNGYTVSSFDFRDPLIKKTIHAIKYYHRLDLIAPLSEKLSEEIKQTLPSYKDYVLVPIPMPRLRKIMRGYNQAEIIAGKLAHLLQIPMRNDILIRSTYTKRQVTTSTKDERRKNQKDTFSVRDTASGLRILLIDDVTTTGATLDEARTVLLRHKALTVHAATLAH